MGVTYCFLVMMGYGWCLISRCTLVELCLLVCRSYIYRCSFVYNCFKRPFNPIWAGSRFFKLQMDPPSISRPSNLLIFVYDIS
jgi:hypothetical protein